MRMSFSFLLVLALSGCPKTGSTTDPVPDTVSANPKEAYADGVKILQGQPGKIDYAGALARFESATTADPAFTKAWFNAGYAAERTGDLAKAATYYRKAVELKPDYTAAVFNLGDVLKRAGKAEEAVAVYQAFVEKNPEDLKARSNLVDALIAAKRYDDAILQAREVLLRDAKNVGAYRNLSSLYYAQGNYAMSQLCGEKARTLSETDPGIYNNIGVTYLAQKDEQRAIEQFKTAVKIDPGNVQANLNLGYLALNSGDYGLAKTSLEAVVQADPGNLDAQLGYAVALRGINELKEAEDLYDKLLKKYPTHRTLVFNASTLHEKYTKQFTKAKKILQDYQAAMAGQIAPSDELFERIKRVEDSETAERKRKEEEDRKAKEAAERKARAEKLLKDMDVQIKKMEADLQKYASCVDPGVQELVMMVVEQVKPVIAENDESLANEVKTFLDDASAQLDAAVAGCAGTPPTEGLAPAPAPETPAPAPGTAPPTP